MQFLKTNPARFHALLVMLAGLGVAYMESGKLGLALAVLGLLGGETVQRVEDGKTLKALLTPVDEEH